MTRTLTRRLNQLEEQIIPAVEPAVIHVIQVVLVDSDGKRENGRKFEVPMSKLKPKPRR